MFIFSSVRHKKGCDFAAKIWRFRVFSNWNHAKADFMRFPPAMASGKPNFCFFQCASTLILHKIASDYSASVAGFAVFLVVFLAAGFFSSAFASSALTSASLSTFLADFFAATFSFTRNASNFSFIMEFTI